MRKRSKVMTQQDLAIVVPLTAVVTVMQSQYLLYYTVIYAETRMN